MTLKQKVTLAWFATFLTALLVGVLNRSEAGLSLMPTGGLVIRSVMAAFALTFLCLFVNTSTNNKKFLAILVAGFFFSLVLGAATKSWPAEPSNVHHDALPGEPVKQMPEVENWAVTDETTTDYLFLIKIHQDPDDPNKLGFTEWFPNKDKNYEYEVFVRMVDFVKNGKKVDISQSKGYLKLQNGNWSEVIAGNRLFVSVGLLNGEQAIIFRAVDDNGKTRFFRAFLIKDLIKPKN